MKAAISSKMTRTDWQASSDVQWASIWTAPWQQVENWELVPGYPLKSDNWVIPSHWASGGAFKRLSARTVNFARNLPDGWSRSDLRSELAVRRLKRIACLMFFRTVRVGRLYKQPPKPSTWVGQVDDLAKAVGTALATGYETNTACTSSCPDGPTIFRHLTPGQLWDLKEKNKNFAHAVIARMNGLFADEAFDDWPSADVEVLRYKLSSGYLPFNDDFTAAICAAALWMVEEIGSDLIDCWSGLKKIDEASGRTETVQAKRKEFIASWSGGVLKPGFQYPYQFRLKTHDGTKVASFDSVSWPPSHKSSLRGMMMRLQEAHGIIISLGIGPRDGEVTDLPRDCLLDVYDGGVLLGQTFKISDHPDGETRHWPLPTTVVYAILQQQRLAEIIDPGGHYLFVPFLTTTAIDDGKRSYLGLASFAKRVKLLDGRELATLCEGNVHSHRFRKTVVRLAALSLVGANQILFDILGHRDPEMTLNYILSDPQLQDEMREIARQAAVALAADALRNSQSNGGPAAKLVDDFAKRLIPRSGQAELEISSLNRAAEILSQGGRIMLVRSGILCTKTFNQAGPCTKRAGKPDIGNCAVDCNHRLELAAAKSDHRRAIQQILGLIPSQGHFMRPWWQGQLIAHLTPFEDLRDEMLANSKVRAALAGAKMDLVDELIEPSARASASALLASISA